MKKIIGLLICSSCILFDTVLATSKESTSQSKNVLFIAIDDLNTDIGCMNPEKKVKTPHIDRLAREGLLFKNAHCSSPSCHPSRVAVLTGKSPLNTGITNNLKDEPSHPSWRLSPILKNTQTIPEYFRSIGYTVKGSGKIFHGAQYYATEENDPDIWDSYYPSKTRQIPDQPVPPFDYFSVNKSSGRPAGHFDWTPLQVSDNAMSDYKVVDWALNEFQQNHDKPFFMAVGMFRPHVPFHVPQKYYDMYSKESIQLPEKSKNSALAIGDGSIVSKFGYDEFKWAEQTNNVKNALQGYYASVTFCDTMIGRLLDGLRDSKYANNTIIVLWSDNGYHLSEKNRFEKFTLWRESTHVPLIIKVPNLTKNHSICTQPVNLIDIFPTLVDLTGGMPSNNLDGESLLPWLNNPDLIKNSPSVIVGPEPGSWAVVSNKYRFIHYFNGMEELYDIIDDPKEERDLSNNSKYNYIIDYFKSIVKPQIPEFIPEGAKVN